MNLHEVGVAIIYLGIFFSPAIVAVFSANPDENNEVPTVAEIEHQS